MHYVYVCSLSLSRDQKLKSYICWPLEPHEPSHHGHAHGVGCHPGHSGDPQKLGTPSFPCLCLQSLNALLFLGAQAHSNFLKRCSSSQDYFLTLNFDSGLVLILIINCEFCLHYSPVKCTSMIITEL